MPQILNISNAEPITQWQIIDGALTIQYDQWLGRKFHEVIGSYEKQTL